MSALKKLVGSYCKIAVVPHNETDTIVQSGFIKSVDMKHHVLFLENENGVVHIPLNTICAVKKMMLNE